MHSAQLIWAADLSFVQLILDMISVVLEIVLRAYFTWFCLASHATNKFRYQSLLLSLYNSLITLLLGSNFIQYWKLILTNILYWIAIDQSKLLMKMFHYAQNTFDVHIKQTEWIEESSHIHCCLSFYITIVKKILQNAFFLAFVFCFSKFGFRIVCYELTEFIKLSKWYMIN